MASAWDLVDLTNNSEGSGPEEEEDSFWDKILDSPKPNVDLLGTKQDATDCLTTMLGSVAQAGKYFDDLCCYDSNQLIQEFSKTANITSDLPPVLESYLANDLCLSKLNSKVFQSMHSPPDGYEYMRRTVFSKPVDDLLNSIQNVKYKHLDSVEYLISLAIQIHKKFLEMNDESLHSLMYEEKNDLVGWNRSVHNNKWVYGKRWAYTIYAMGAMIPFGHFNIPLFNKFFSSLVMYARENPTVINYETMIREVDLLFMLIFGSVMNNQVRN